MREGARGPDGGRLGDPAAGEPSPARPPDGAQTRDRGPDRARDLVAPGVGSGLVVEVVAALLSGADAGALDALDEVRGLVEALPLVVAVLDGDLVVERCLGGALSRLGTCEVEVAGRPFDMGGGDWARHAARVLAGETVRFDCVGSNGDRPWALRHVVAPRAGGGALAIAVDVTEQVTAERALAESEDRFRRLADAAPVGIFVTDADGHVVYANAEAERQTGSTVGRLLGRDWEPVVHPDDLDDVLSREESYLSSDDRRFEFTVRLLPPGGEERWIQARAEKLTDQEGRQIGTVAVTEDITERRRAEERLRDREERTRAIIENAAQGIVTCARDGEVLELNASAERIFGVDSDDAIGGCADRLFTEGSARLLAGRRAELCGALDDGGDVAAVVDEVEACRSDGTRVPVEVSSAPLRTGGRCLVTHLVRDLSERHELTEQLHYQATHDDLTGLANRALLRAHLSSALTRASYNRSDLAVLYVHLERLAMVTDALGHSAADELVFQAAERMRIVCEPTDLVCRFDAGSFVVVVEDLRDVTGAVGRASSIIEILGEPFGLTDDEAFIVPQVGLAYAPRGRGATTDSLVGDAALAAQRAGETGGPGFELFDGAMRARIDERRRTENALRRGIERDEMELHYQPVVSLDSGEVRGFEALVRWNRPGVGRVAPGDFIPVAEDSGLILPLGNWILREACLQLGRWQEEYPGRRLNLSVNLSARQLTQYDLQERLAESIEAGGFEPSRLILEITETVLLNDLDAAARTLAAVKAQGVRIAMDDFGTGYSSLTYLRRFPIDIVKIDRSFVGALGTDSRDSSIVDMVITLARSLGITVVAEGVETEPQRAALGALGCPYAQGYHFSAAEPASAVPELLAILRP